MGSLASAGTACSSRSSEPGSPKAAIVSFSAGSVVVGGQIRSSPIGRIGTLPQAHL